ncbi:thioesterase family protein [Salinisphaera aquimarina]|uniref:Thioesterase family protein n=1 Tax=Salinisphaera aquimarina TaxID=2094031 RepID=A0ABV7ENU4_9GAMM
MSGMREVARNSVQSWEIDQMGHMNVQFYVEKASDGLATLAVQLGMGPSYARGRHASLRERNLHVRFLRERRSGSPYFLRAGVLEVSTQQLRVYQEMVDGLSGEIAATFTSDVELVDSNSGHTLDLPACARSQAMSWQAEHPEHGRPRGLDMSPPRRAPTLAEAEALGMAHTYQAQVQPAQCDAQGRLARRHYMGAVSNAVPNLLAQTRGDDRSRTPSIGGAALEYRFVYRETPRAGDVLTLRSGLKQVSAKTYIWCHWLFDLDSGACVATAEAVAITLDLEARKAIPIPEELRSRLEALVIDGLGV